MSITKILDEFYRQPMCIPSSSEIIPQIQHKNKVTRLGGTSLRNLSNDIQLMRKRAVAPPKPKRTFMEAMNKPRTSNFSVITSEFTAKQ
uniref:Uncharacterized protein n=1 Tax=Heterorhabditis bacteriophora TaxID=37862 RepID=A0A1I7XER5_HETBA